MYCMLCNVCNVRKYVLYRNILCVIVIYILTLIDYSQK